MVQLDNSQCRYLVANPGQGIQFHQCENKAKHLIEGVFLHPEETQAVVGVCGVHRRFVEGKQASIVTGKGGIGTWGPTTSLFKGNASTRSQLQGKLGNLKGSLERAEDALRAAQRKTPATLTNHEFFRRWAKGKERLDEVYAIRQQLSLEYDAISLTINEKQARVDALKEEIEQVHMALQEAL